MSKDFLVLPPALRKREAVLHSTATAGASSSASSLTATSRSLMQKAEAPKKKKKSPLRVRPIDSQAGSNVDEYLPRVAVQTLEARQPADPGMRATPATVHFAGFTPGNRHKAILRIRNISVTAQRVFVTPISASEDDGAFFSAEVVNAGRIAPGMAQEVTVVFSPTEPRYYYASIRVVGETGELQIPLHAYPVASSFSFPTRLDFGRSALTQSVVRTITLTPGVPIDFDVEFTVLTAHPDFTMQPMSATIPAGGCIDVTVTYTPTSLTTAFAEYTLRTSQAHSVPQRVVLNGSATPGLGRDKRLMQALAESERLAAGGADGTPAVRDDAWPPVPVGVAQSGLPTPVGSVRAGQYPESWEEGEGGEGEVRHEGLASVYANSEGLHEGMEEGEGGQGTGRAGQGGGASRGAGQRRWLARDPGVALQDDKLEAYKVRSETALLTALADRSRVVDAMAESLRLATGVNVGRTGAIKAVQGVLLSMGKAHAPVDDYGNIPSTGRGGGGGHMAALASASQYRNVGGTRLPPSLPLGAQKELDYVLSQKPGLTAPRDLPLKLAEARQAREAARAAQARLRDLAQGVVSEGASGEERSELEHKSAGSRSVSPPKQQAALSLSRKSFAGEIAHNARRAAVLQGPGLSPLSIVAAELAGTWLFPALQGVSSHDLLPLLQSLLSTPDTSPVGTGTLLDEVLGNARAQLMDSVAAQIVEPVKHVGDGLPSVLAALVRAAAAPMRRPRQLREEVFSREFSELESAQKSREFAGYPWVGETLMSVGDVSRVRQLRALLRALEDVVQRRMHRTRRTTVAVPAGGLRAVHEALGAAAQTAVDGSGSARPKTEGGLRATLLAATAVKTGAAQRAAAIRAAGSDPAEQFPILSSPVVKAAMLPLSSPVAEAGARASAVPSFRDETSSASDGWSLTRDAVARFVESISAAVVRRRVKKRLVLLERKLEGAALRAGGNDLGATRAFVATLVEQEHKRSGMEGAGSWVLRYPAKVDPKAPANLRAIQEAEVVAGPQLMLDLTPSRITRVVLPMSPPEESAEVGSTEVRGWDLRVPLPVDIPVWFCEEAAFTVPEWPHAEAEGYTPLPLPVAPTHQPREEGRYLREGALHETAATGFLPLPCASTSLDARLAVGVESARGGAVLPRGGLGSISGSGLAVRVGWDALGEPHASDRFGPVGMAVHPATGHRSGGPTEGEAGYGLSASSWVRQPYMASQPDAPPTLLGHRQAYTCGAGIGGMPPPPGVPVSMMPPSAAGAMGPRDADWISTQQDMVGLPIRGPRNTLLSAPAAAACGSTFAGSPLDVNGVLPTQGQVMGSCTGLASLRHATGPLPGANVSSTNSTRVSASFPAPAPHTSLPLPAWEAHSYVGTTSRPACDLSQALLGERPQAQLKADGTVRLPTDVTPLDVRDWYALAVPSGRDPWLPTSLPALLTCPVPMDALSDDSESDPEREEEGALRRGEGSSSPRSVAFAYDSGGSGGEEDGSVQASKSVPSSRLPRRRGPPPPTLEHARSLFLPKSMRSSASVGGASRMDGAGRLRADAIEPAGSHVAHVHSLRAGAAAPSPSRPPLVMGREATALAVARAEYSSAWESTHWMESLLVGLPRSDAGEAGQHPPRLGAGSGPGLAGVHVHDQAQQGAHVRAHRGSGNGPAPGTVSAGLADTRRHFVMRAL